MQLSQSDYTYVCNILRSLCITIHCKRGFIRFNQIHNLSCFDVIVNKLVGYHATGYNGIQVHPKTIREIMGACIPRDISQLSDQNKKRKMISTAPAYLDGI